MSIKIKLQKKELNDGALYFTELFGQRITLSRRLVAQLKSEGLLKKEVEVGEHWRLTAQTVERSGKTYTNFYFSTPKAETAAEDDPPF